MYFSLIIFFYLLYDKELFEITSSSKFLALYDILFILQRKVLWQIANARSSRTVHICLLSLSLIKLVYVFFSDN